MDAEEVTAFLESVRRYKNPMYAAYVLIVVLSPRKGEVSGLMWNNIDFDEGVLTPERQSQRVSRQLLLHLLKTDDSSTDLPLPKICATALPTRIDQQGEDEFKAGRRGKTSTWSSPWHADRVSERPPVLPSM